MRKFLNCLNIHRAICDNKFIQDLWFNVMPEEWIPEQILCFKTLEEKKYGTIEEFINQPINAQELAFIVLMHILKDNHLSSGGGVNQYESPIKERVSKQDIQKIVNIFVNKTDESTYNYDLYQALSNNIHCLLERLKILKNQHNQFLVNLNEIKDRIILWSLRQTDNTIALKFFQGTLLDLPKAEINREQFLTAAIQESAISELSKLYSNAKIFYAALQSIKLLVDAYSLKSQLPFFLFLKEHDDYQRNAVIDKFDKALTEAKKIIRKTKNTHPAGKKILSFTKLSTPHKRHLLSDFADKKAVEILKNNILSIDLWKLIRQIDSKSQHLYQKYKDAS